MVGLELSPPEHALVLSVAAQSPVPPRDRTPPMRPLTPGQAARGTHDSVRHGTAARVAARNVARGVVIGTCDRQHRPPAFLTFRTESDVPVAREPRVEIPLIRDHEGTHTTAVVKRWFERHPASPLHVTPTSGSGLNQVERFVAASTAKRIRRSALRNVAALERAIRESLADHNENPPAVRGDRKRRPETESGQEGW